MTLDTWPDRHPAHHALSHVRPGIGCYRPESYSQMVHGALVCKRAEPGGLTHAGAFVVPWDLGLPGHPQL